MAWATGVQSEARVVAEVVRGATRCTTLRSAPPLTFRPTPDGLYLVGTMAGPVGGDDLGLDLHVGHEAELSVRSAAASLVLPGPSGRPSHWRARVSVGRSASLHWEPEPTVLVRGCDHRARLRLELSAHASLWWREEIVVGRHTEPGGSLQQQVDVLIDGRLVHRSQIRLGPQWPGSTSPATFGAVRGVGTVLVAGRDASVLTPATNAGVAVHALAEGLVLVMAVGATLSEVRGLLGATWARNAGLR